MTPPKPPGLGDLDIEAVKTVKEEAWPQAQSADELHDALVLCGFLTEEEGERGDTSGGWLPYFEELVEQNRATVLEGVDGNKLWVAAERLCQVKRALPDSVPVPEINIPEKLRETAISREEALVEIIRGRLESRTGYGCRYFGSAWRPGIGRG